MSSHGRTLDYRYIASDPRARMVWWLVCLVVFLAPLPLGANRPWAWSLLAGLEFIVVALFLLFARQHVLPPQGASRSLFYLLLALAVMPLLQLMPLPIAVMQVIGPGSVQAWLLTDPTATAVPASIDGVRTLDIGIRQGATLLMALVMLRLFQYRDVRWQFVNLLITVGVLNAAVGLAMFFSGTSMAGTYVNKNHFAGLMCMVLPLAVGAVIRRWRQCRSRSHSPGSDYRFVILLVAAVLLGIALVLSGSRGALLATTLALLLVSVLFARSWSEWTKWALRLMLLAALAALAVALVAGFAEVTDIYARSFNNERVVQWLDTLHAVPHYWLLGSGAGTYDYVYPAFKSPEQGYPRFDHAHNDYLELLLTTGVVGGALALAALVTVIRLFMSANVLRDGLAGRELAFAACWSVLTALIHAIVDFNLQIPANFLIFMLVLMLLASRSSQQSKRARID